MTARKAAAHTTIEAYRIFSTGVQLVTLVAMIFGGLSVYTTLVSNQNVQSAAIAGLSDDQKQTHAKLDLINQQLTQVQISLANKADKK